MANQSTLPTKLKARARGWASQLTILAKAYAPNHLKPYISSHVEEVGDGTFRIRLVTDRIANPAEKYGSLDARAQEYGSGLRARRGPRKEYPIVSKKGMFGGLAFYENAAGTWDYDMFDPPMPRAHLQDGRGLFYVVQHPGIEAANAGKGYMAPAVKELKKKARQELDKDIRSAIMNDVRMSFRNAKRSK